VFSGTVERRDVCVCVVWFSGDDLHRARANIFGNLHSCCMLPNVMVPWHVVMSARVKLNMGTIQATRVRRVRHYLSAQKQNCDGNDCTACKWKVMINGGEEYLCSRTDSGEKKRAQA